MEMNNRRTEERGKVKSGKGDYSAGVEGGQGQVERAKHLEKMGKM